jgi:hypothetical protein
MDTKNTLMPVEMKTILFDSFVKYIPGERVFCVLPLRNKNPMAPVWHAGLGGWKRRTAVCRSTIHPIPMNRNPFALLVDDASDVDDVTPKETKEIKQVVNPSKTQEKQKSTPKKEKIKDSRPEKPSRGTSPQKKD